MVILWGLVGAALFFGGVAGGKVLLLTLALGSLSELMELLNRVGYRLNWGLLYALLLGLGGAFFDIFPHPLMAAITLTTLTHLPTRRPIIIGFNPAAAALADALTPQRPHNLAVALGALLIIYFGFGSLAAIHSIAHAHSLWWVIWAVAVIKFSDANAYLFGTHFGRRRIAPTISAHKSYEGLFGAVLAGLILGVYGAPLFPNLWIGPILGPLLSLLGSLGDLAESALKRAAQVKDSGNTLPGIGGLLDLTDSLIFASPAAFIFIRFFAQ